MTVMGKSGSTCKGEYGAECELCVCLSVCVVFVCVPQCLPEYVCGSYVYVCLCICLVLLFFVGAANAIISFHAPDNKDLMPCVRLCVCLLRDI